MRCDIQDRGNYQPCRMFIENSVAKDITMNSVKAKVAISRRKLWVNQYDKALRKQQSWV